MRKLLITLAAVLMTLSANASDWVVETNVIPWIDGAPNLTLNYAVAPQHTVSLGGGFRPWPLGERNEDHIKRYAYGNAAYRYWFCQKYDGWFVGGQINGGQYNLGGVKLPFGVKYVATDHRVEGWVVGGGVIGGFGLPISKHWNAQFEIGIGYEYFDYKKFRSPMKCDPLYEKKHDHYFGPNDLSISLQYVF